MIEGVYEEVKTNFDKTLKVLQESLMKIRTGRANAAIFDGITVDYYGTQTPIGQVASITIPEPRLIIIQPWEASFSKAIENAITSSDLGLNPVNDGKMLRVPLPPLSEERRKELAKLVKKTGEDSKVAVRNLRRDANDNVKNLEKGKKLPEDDAKKALTKIQEMTDEAIKKIDDIVQAKENEVLTV